MAQEKRKLLIKELVKSEDKLKKLILISIEKNYKKDLQSLLAELL